MVWRGLGDHAFKVESTLVRALRKEGVEVTEANLRQREVEILRVARNWDIGLSEHGSVTDMHLLAMLQHHGAPTRLIDVTFNPLTALWFACSDSSMANLPGVLVVMTVSDAPSRVTSDIPTLTYDTVTMPREATVISAMRKSQAIGGPLLIEPRPKDERMKAQEGAFLAGVFPDVPQDGPVVGFQWSGFAPLLPFTLRALESPDANIGGTNWQGFSYAGIVISPEIKRQLLPVLDRTFNRSHRTMYPDMPGFVATLKQGLLRDELGSDGNRGGDLPVPMPEYWQNA
ncbi:FRG domain-containing protein [Arthrobacter sp. ISL-48]|uniref:FRG domain-containing protein n=1 Tax=Arthrobacter sp. ISL-48 TaxID=2819110 RepID=UPI001BEBD7D4|nr:FRG domain-containing protein [Arthrobacter sp. ISL-48]MBT2532794.1 FRG domain-containing protein [Arthrobacter sp. ISL-48]